MSGRTACFHSRDCRPLFVQQCVGTLSKRGVPACCWAFHAISGGAPSASLGAAFPHISLLVSPCSGLQVFDMFFQHTFSLAELDLILRTKNTWCAYNRWKCVSVFMHASFSLSKLGQELTVLLGSHAESKGRCATSMWLLKRFFLPGWAVFLSFILFSAACFFF